MTKTPSDHHCHYPPCKAACPPRHLMCARHWRMVPKDVQEEVYKTVRLRDRTVNASWAPWWRAQAEAIHAVGEQCDPGDGCERHYAREMAFAETLEQRP